jgi:CheY-like chemotaxis protein
MDGVEATQAIRKMQPPHVRLQVVAVSASAAGDDEHAMLLAGCNSFLPKPVRLATLRTMLAPQ